MNQYKEYIIASKIEMDWCWDLNCKVCGLPVKKGMRFVLAGSYPSSIEKYFFPRFRLDDPDVWGELYHEACYVKSIKNQEQKQKAS